MCIVFNDFETIRHREPRKAHLGVARYSFLSKAHRTNKIVLPVPREKITDGTNANILSLLIYHCTLCRFSTSKCCFIEMIK